MANGFARMACSLLDGRRSGSCAPWGMLAVAVAVGVAVAVAIAVAGALDESIGGLVTKQSTMQSTSLSQNAQ